MLQGGNREDLLKLCCAAHSTCISRVCLVPRLLRGRGLLEPGNEATVECAFTNAIYKLGL